MGGQRHRSKQWAERWGGFAVLINNKWCHPEHIRVKDCFCNTDIELLVVSLRLCCFPREFTVAVVAAVKILQTQRSPVMSSTQ